MLKRKFYSKNCTNVSLYDFVCKLFMESNVRQSFLKKLEHRYDVLLFGGCVRDYLMFGREYEIRDVDLVLIGVKNNNNLEKIIKQSFNLNEWSYNQFGGFKIRINNLAIDCWRIEDTYAFRNKRLEMCVENLIDTPMLNIDRYAYSMNNKQFISDCNLFTPSEVDFCLYDENLLEINLVRALFYSKKYGLKLSSAVKQKLKQTLLNEMQMKKMVDFQAHHFENEKFDLDEVLRSFC